MRADLLEISKQRSTRKAANHRVDEKAQSAPRLKTGGSVA
jgi:hypothetical protein